MGSRRPGGERDPRADPGAQRASPLGQVPPEQDAPGAQRGRRTSRWTNPASAARASGPTTMACAPQYDMSRQKLARSAGVTGDTGQHQVQVPSGSVTAGRTRTGTELGGRPALNRRSSGNAQTRPVARPSTNSTL